MKSFDELGLIPALLDAISARGFETPTPIQAEMIPFLLTENRDVTGLAQTGTGKTAAFALPLLANLNLKEKKQPQVLVLAPTRELAIQVAEAFQQYAKHLTGFRVVADNVLAVLDGLRVLHRGVAGPVGEPPRRSRPRLIRSPGG